MRDVPLVELVVAGHEHGRGAAIGATGTAGLLPHRRERAGKAVEHHGVEPAHVDSELEGIRRGHTEEPATREVELEIASLRREIAGAVRRHPRAEAGLGVFEQPARVLRDQLRAAATARERERRMTGPHES